MKVPMTEVIAVRRLSWEGEPNREVLVSIGKPAEGPDSQGGFHCPIHTVGLGNDEIITSIFGVDGFQAIELALRFIGWRLADINSKNGGRLQWLDGQLPIRIHTHIGGAVRKTEVWMTLVQKSCQNVDEKTGANLANFPEVCP